MEFSVGDLAYWDGGGSHVRAEPQTVRIAAVRDFPTRTYDFHFQGHQDHPDGPVRVRGFARHVHPDHLVPATGETR